MADTTEILDDAMIDPVTGEIIDQKDLAERLLAQAKEQGVSGVVVCYAIGSALSMWHPPRRIVGAALFGAVGGGLLGAVLVDHVKGWVANSRPQLPCKPLDAIGYGMPSGHAQTSGTLLAGTAPTSVDLWG